MLKEICSIIMILFLFKVAKADIVDVAGTADTRKVEAAYNQQLE